MLLLMGNVVRGGQGIAWEHSMGRSAPLARAWPSSSHTWNQLNRFWSKTKESSTSGKGEEGTKEPQPPPSESPEPSTNSPEQADATPSPTIDEVVADQKKLVGELQAQLKEQEEKQSKLSEKVQDLTDRLKRTLAEMENVRTRSAREVENVKRFGPQALIKDLLDVPDNLERATAMVPPSVTAGGDDETLLEPAKVRALLKGLVEGVQV
jgi:molecular chaperone GrpE (heat shock protein)